MFNFDMIANVLVHKTKKVILISKLMLSWTYTNLPNSIFRQTCDSMSNLFHWQLLKLSTVLLIFTCTLIH